MSMFDLSNYPAQGREATNYPLEKDAGVLRRNRSQFFVAGQESSTKPPAQNTDMFELLQNILPPSVSGTLRRRWGYTQLNASTAIAARRAYEYQKDSDGSRRLLATAADGTGSSSSSNVIVAFNEDGSTYNSSVFVPASGAVNPRVVPSRDYAYVFDGVESKKWDGSSSGGVTKTGIDAPVTAINVGSPITGAITLIEGRSYFLVFKNSTAGHYSGLSPVSATTGVLTNQNVQLTSLEVSSDAQVDKKTILATADGGDETTLYELVELDNAVTTYTDDTPEETLLTQEIFQETDDTGADIGVADNTPPPTDLDFPTKHQGRIFGASGQSLFYTKSLEELLTSTGLIVGRYEEAWPADNQLDISEGAETVHGLMSDGETLWIGTERHIRRLTGMDATNFQLPVIAFNGVGLLNQETWQAVFLQGAPIGVMWMTPDFKVIGSDFNSYVDVGAPVQDVLDTINTAQSSKCSAMYVAYGNYDLYMVAIPTGSNTECDTVLVFDLKGKTWHVWVPTDNVTTQLFNIPASGKPQGLFWTSGGKLYKWDTAQIQDRVSGTPVSFPCIAKTTWQDFDDATTRKALNSIEVAGDESDMTIAVDGASHGGEFDSPHSVIGATSVASEELDEMVLPLAGSISRDRFYQFTFSATGTNPLFLQSYTLEAVPLHRI